MVQGTANCVMPLAAWAFCLAWSCTTVGCQASRPAESTPADAAAADTLATAGDGMTGTGEGPIDAGADGPPPQEVVSDALDISPDVEPEAQAGPDADAEPADPYCHHDCAPYQECKDGVVKSFSPVPVPCIYWKGECTLNDAVWICKEGCRKDISPEPVTDQSIRPAQWLCAEAVVKSAGAQCKTDVDCHGAFAWSKGQPQMNFLACDVTTTHTCVPAPEPVIAGWGSSCGIPGLAASYKNAGYGNIVAASACPSGACAVLPGYEGGSSCVRSGCTAPCYSDSECPKGAFCANPNPMGTGPVKGMHCLPFPMNSPKSPWKCEVP